MRHRKKRNHRTAGLAEDLLVSLAVERRVPAQPVANAAANARVMSGHGQLNSL